MKKMQRIGAWMLAAVMMCASVFAQPAFLSNAATENEMSIAYDKVDSSNFFNFQGTLSNGQTLQAAGYNWSTASGTVQAGTKQTGGAIDWVSFTVNNNLSFVAGGENLIIWYDTLVANNYDAIKIEEGTVFTFSGKASVKVTNTLYLEKSEAGVWEDKSEEYFDGNEMSIAFDKVDAGNCFNFQGTLSDGKTLAESGYDWSLASGTIQAAKKQAGSLDWADYPLNAVLSFAAGDVNLIILYDTVIASDYDAIQIAEGTIFTFDGKTKVKITNTLELEKNSAGVWGLKSDEPEVSELGLSFDKMTDAWYFNADVTPEANYYRVEMEVDGTKYTVPISNTKDGKFVIWPDFFTNIGGAPNAPTSTLKIAKGATLAPSSDAWADSPTGTRYTLKEGVSLEYHNGAWVAEGSVPKEMGLTFEELTDKWVFASDVTPEAKFYRVEMEIDGTNYTVPIENTNDGKFVIWASYFTDIGGAASEPTSTLKIAKGATLVPSTDAWTDDAIGTRYVLKEAIDLTYEYGAWGVAGRQIEVSQIALDAYSWGGGTDGVIGITIGNLAELQATTWYPTIVTETNTTWGKLRGTVLVDGQPKEVDVQIPGNGEVFIYYNAAEIPESFVIPKGTDFIPVMGSANQGKYAIQFKEDYGVNLVEKLVGAPGVQVDYQPLDVTKLSVQGFGDQAEQNRSYLIFLADKDLLPAGADWWNNYDMVNAVVLIDGKAHDVAFGGGGASDILAMYLPWDTGETDILANANEILIQKDAIMSVGLKGLKINQDLKLKRVGSIWISEYTQEEEKQPIPSNALKVDVQFGQITGQNILGIKGTITGNKQLLDIYGDWSTAYGPIKLGVRDGNGKMVYTTIKSTIYSISDNIYLSGVDLSLYDAVLIEAGTVLQPDSSLCKSDTPIVLTDKFAMERNADDEWKVTAGAVEEVNKGNVSDKNTTDSNTSDSTGDTEGESNETEAKPAEEYDGTTMIHRKDAEDKDDVSVGNSPSDGSIGIKVAVVALAVLVIAATVVVCIVAKNRKKDS